MINNNSHTRETNFRSLVKTLTWRLIGSTSAATISYIITGSILVASSIGISHMIVNSILYWLHERIWSRILWGVH